MLLPFVSAYGYSVSLFGAGGLYASFHLILLLAVVGLGAAYWFTNQKWAYLSAGIGALVVALLGIIKFCNVAFRTSVSLNRRIYAGASLHRARRCGRPPAHGTESRCGCSDQQPECLRWRVRRCADGPAAGSVWPAAGWLPGSQAGQPQFGQQQGGFQAPQAGQQQFGQQQGGFQAPQAGQQQFGQQARLASSRASSSPSSPSSATSPTILSALRRDALRA